MIDRGPGGDDRLTSCRRQLEVAERQIENLQAALVSARRIGAAVGILMATEKITDHEAFTRLSRTSQERNRKLRDLAEEVILTGHLV